ncbi:hypothetical protein PHMEG_00023541 [Phytophthora megakarya]|uniref:AN1-type domain-containing protein n=1 Tax=Phytophthora megakarya TaxID=4795 RepID=A0A225VFX2_9STRA|nr:hypothetical protein PHMEG_00023541 [Phytophthora megakarya]
MARSSSPVFNEPAPDASEMVTKTSTPSSAPADAASVSSASATSTATGSSTVVASTPAPTSGDCLKAPSGAASPSSVDAPEASASPQRYTRMPPAMLQSVKATLTYRKSCLKRSNVDAPEASASPQRYTRMPPAMLQSVKATLTYRKSCLKRSKSTVLPPSGFCDEKPIVKVEEKTEKKEEKPVQKNRRRCWECKVKVGLTAVKCRCDYTFCGKHRYAEEHNCAFNFKTAGKRKLEEENPVVVPCKVARIN